MIDYGGWKYRATVRTLTGRRSAVMKPTLTQHHTSIHERTERTDRTDIFYDETLKQLLHYADSQQLTNFVVSMMPLARWSIWMWTCGEQNLEGSYSTHLH